MAFPFHDEIRSRRSSPGTWALIALCIGVFAFLQPSQMQWSNESDSSLTAAFEAREVTDFEYRWAVVPCRLTHGTDAAECGTFPATSVDDTGAAGRWGPLVTALFLHANLLHLIGNLVFLAVFGRGLEDRIGAAGVIGTFLAGGLVAFLAFVLVRPDETLPVLGASGAVAAIMGAFLVLQPRRRILSVVYAAGFQVVYLPAWAVLSFFFASQFFTTPGEQIAWEAHVTGMIFGAVVAVAWLWRDPTLGRDEPAEPVGLPVGEPPVVGPTPSGTLTGSRDDGPEGPRLRRSPPPAPWHR